MAYIVCRISVSMNKVKDYLKNNIWQILVFLFCAGISLSLAFNKSIGIDERFSLEWSVWPIPGFWDRIQLDVCPSYMLFLRPVLLLTDGSLLAGKLFSWVAFVICLLVGYFFVRKTCGDYCYLLYSMFFIGSPLILEKSVEVRMYAMAYACIIIVGILWYRIICSEDRASHWFMFVTVSLVAAYTHYYTLLSLVLIYASMVFWFIISKDLRKLKYILLCSFVMCLGYGPWLTVIMRQTNSETTSWIPMTESRLGPIRDIFDTHGIQLKMYMMYVVLVITAYALWQFIKRRDAESFWSIACISISWIIMIFGEIFQIYVRPILVDRYMTIPFCLFIIGSVVTMRKANRYVIIGLSAVFLLCCLVDYPGLHEELYIINVG